MIHSGVRSKDLKSRKLHSFFSNSIGTISNVTTNLLVLKNNKILPPDEIRKNLGNPIHYYTYTIAILSHLNTTIEQNCQEHIGSCLDNQYDVPPSSEWLFGDNFTKRIMDISIKKKAAPKNSF